MGRSTSRSKGRIRGRCREIHKATVAKGRVEVGSKTGAVTDIGAGAGEGTGARSGSGAKEEKKVQGRDYRNGHSHIWSTISNMFVGGKAVD